MTTGIRLHEDEEDRLQREDGFRMQDKLLVPTSFGAPGSNSNRVGTATVRSAFVDANFRTGRWSINPGLRFEDIDLVRNDYAKTDPDRAMGTTRIRSNNVSALIPGIGALYEIDDNWRILAGIHKGFNPPAPGSSAGEETSLNVEAGARFNGELLSFEAIYFLNNYDNLVGTVTDSTGGGGQVGDQFDGGEVTVRGLELSANSGWNELGNTNIDVPVSLRYTWTEEATFNNAFDSDYGPWGNVQAGDQLPYVPQHQLRASAGLESQSWTVTLAVNYVGRSRSVAGQGEFVPEESINSHVVWDGLASWNINDTFSTYVKVDNLFDEIYVAARRPAGIRPGLGRTAYAGLTVDF